MYSVVSKKTLTYKAVPLTTSFIKPRNNEAHNIEGCIACSSAVIVQLLTDHMVDMLKYNISNCKAIGDVKMCHTNCTYITTNVLCPH